MAETVTGGCACGAIRYEVSAEPIASGACHCRACQYAAGGAPSYAMVVPRPAFAITKGTPRAHWSRSETGNRVARYFCPDCGTPLHAESEAFPQVVSIKPGSLDDPSQFRPMVNLWVSAAQPWHHIDRALPKFEKNYV
jgi:hypothetical protein